MKKFEEQYLGVSNRKGNYALELDGQTTADEATTATVTREVLQWLNITSRSTAFQVPSASTETDEEMDNEEINDEIILGLDSKSNK
jgi:hypothetical protein